MKKTLVLSVIASTMIMAGGDIVPVEPIVEAPAAVEEESVGTVSGQLRGFYINRAFSGIKTNTRSSLTVGGWIGYDTAEWNGLSAGTKFYVLEGFKLRSGPYTSATYDPSLYGAGFDEYGFIGEAYLNYKMGNTNLKVGRQKLNTPLAGADDARMLPNLFEAAVLSNTDVTDTTLILAHVTKETVGTFGNVYGASGSQLSLQSGYGLGFHTATSGKFKDMGVVALGEGTDTDGVTAVAAVYSGIENLKLQGWDYYAHDILNAVYLQADYAVSGLKLAAQYINQSETGDALAGNIDSNYWAIKAGTNFGDLSGYLAYSQTGESTGTVTNGGILSPWGGMPAFTQGMVTRHQFFADTATTKAAVTYNFNNITGLNLKATGYYVSFDIGAANTYKPGVAYTAKEAGFDIKYQATKALNLRLRANFPTDFAPGLDWAEYRFIANYNF